MPIGAVRAATDVDIDDAVLARVQIVRHAEGRREFDGPIARFESRIAVEEFKTELQRFARGKLFRATEELRAERITLLTSEGVGARRCSTFVLLTAERIRKSLSPLIG